MAETGIYMIESIVHPERCYIGSAINMSKRWREHRNLLRRGKHHSIILQNHYNMYGESDLVFIIIEQCLKEFLVQREQYHIDNNNSYFNVKKVAGDNHSIKQSDKWRESMKKRGTNVKGKRWKLTPEQLEKHKLVSKQNAVGRVVPRQTNEWYSQQMKRIWQERKSKIA